MSKVFRQKALKPFSSNKLFQKNLHLPLIKGVGNILPQTALVYKLLIPNLAIELKDSAK